MIIEGQLQHAQAICEVIRQSIWYECIEDHKHDPAILKPWLSNKTAENCKQWLQDEHSRSFVSVLNETSVGVSQIGENGYIYLCYVHPEQTRKGVGSQLMAACQEQAQRWRLDQVWVDSTYTAKGFYESQGFSKCGEPYTEDGLKSYPLKLVIGGGKKVAIAL